MAMYSLRYLMCTPGYVQLHCFRFLDSELDVHDEIQKLHVIATAPELYSILVQQNAIPTIVGLLSHENSGILVHFHLRKKYSLR